MIPLSYAKSHAGKPFTNFGDGLSPIVVSLLSGGPVNHQHFDCLERRVVAIGTLLSFLKNGPVDVWGAGIDASLISGRNASAFQENIRIFKIFATRGMLSEYIFKACGVEVGGVFGDPALLLGVFFKKLIARPKDRKGLGLICHLSELCNYSSLARSKFYRFSDENDSRLKFISPVVNSSADFVLQKIFEIASCRYILSSSLHGLILAHAFDIPCAYLAPGSDKKNGLYSPLDFSFDIDHRFRDYFTGINFNLMPIFFQDVNEKIDFKKVVKFLSDSYRPINNLSEISCRLVENAPFPIDRFEILDSIPSQIFQVDV